MIIEEENEIESFSLNSNDGIILKKINKKNKKIIKNFRFTLLNMLFIIFIILSFISIGISSIYIYIPKQSLYEIENNPFQTSTLIFSILLILNGLLWNTLTYFILLHIFNIQISKDYITIKDMCNIFLGSGSLLDITQYFINCYKKIKKRNKIIIILCIIINILIIVLHSFQNLLFGYIINIDIRPIIDGSFMGIPIFNDTSPIPSAANDIINLGLELNLYLDDQEYDYMIYNNDIYTCRYIKAMNKISSNNDFLILSYKACFNSKPINIPVNFNCQKYNECIVIDGKKVNINNYSIQTQFLYHEIERNSNFTWSVFTFAVTSKTSNINCSYIHNDICVIGGGFINHLKILPYYMLISKDYRTIYINDINYFKNFEIESLKLEMLDNITTYDNTLKKLNNFNGASIIYDLILRKQNITTSSLSGIGISTLASGVILNRIPLMERFLGNIYYIMTNFGTEFNYADTLILKFIIKYKYRFLILSLCISCCLFVLIIIYLLITEKEDLIMNTITKEELLKLLLKTENKELRNIVNYNDIKIKLNKDEKKIYILLDY